MTCIRSMITLLCLLCLTVSPVLMAQPTEMIQRDADSFQEAFGKRYLDVLRSQESSDDLSLANDMLAQVPYLAGRPYLLKQLCDYAYELSKPHEGGRKIALEAMDKLMKRQPEEIIYASGRQLALLERDFVNVNGEPRTRIAREIIQIHLRLGDYYDSLNDVTLAKNHYRKADTLSREYAHHATRVKGRNARYDQRMLVETQIADARRAFSQGAKINQAAQKLLMLYIAKKDSPQLAMQYLAYSKSEGTSNLLPKAARHPLELPAEDYLPLAQWYERIATRVDLAGKPLMLKRAINYYRYYLRSHDPATPNWELARTKYNALNNELKTLIQQGNIKRQFLKDPIRKLQWIDLIPLIHPTKHAYFGQWNKSHFGTLTNKQSSFSTLIAPLHVDGNFQLLTEFKTTRGNGSFALSFPVKDRMATVHLGVKDYAGIEMINGVSASKVENPSRVPLKLINNQWYQVRVNVQQDSTRQNVSITVELDGKTIINYTCPITDLSVYEGWGAGEADAKDSQQVLLIGSSESAVTIRKYAINVFSGSLQTNNYDYTQP